MSDISSHLVVVHIPESIEPLDRGDVYEDPLYEHLAELGLGEVVGGGSMFDPGFGVTSVDIEVLLNDLERGIPELIRFLEQREIPQGSSLRFPGTDNPEIPIGKAVGVGLVLDGVNLPAEAYSDESQSSLFEQVDEVLESSQAGRLHGSRSSATHTTFFIYGPDREAIRQALQPVVASHPLCENSLLEDVPDTPATETAR